MRTQVRTACGGREAAREVESLGEMYKAVVQGGPVYDANGANMRS